MKLSESAVLCEGNNRAFAEVYKIYNFKDDDELRAYCDFVIHEPVEWMRGFPAAWKSGTMFSKPRAAFHRLLRAPAVVAELGEAYCEQVHSVVWNAFKAHMSSILEKRGGAVGSLSAANEDKESVGADSEATGLTAESISGESDEELLPPCPPVPVAAAARRRTTPKNTVVMHHTDKSLDYKHKFEVLNRVLHTLLNTNTNAGGLIPLAGADETTRLRSALTLLLAEYARV
jgi:hypothetical protein